MICKAKVENGIIRLPPGINLPDGTEVELSAEDPKPAEDNRSFAERYAKYIGIANDLPTDLAENHDHYLHGHPKR